MKVWTAVPCGQLARYSEFYQSLMSVQLPEGSYVPQQGRGTYIPANQNALARRMLTETDCELFWLTNDDQNYPPDIVMRLQKHFVERSDVDVVTPLCLAHDPPHAPLLYDRRDGDKYYPYWLRKGEHGMIPIIASGGGGMMAHRRVLEAIPYPWWTQHTTDESTGFMQSTEDLDFCEKVVAAGFKIWGDLDIWVVHDTIFGVCPMMMEDGSWVTAIHRSPDTVFRPSAKPALAVDSPLIVQPHMAVNHPRNGKKFTLK